MSFISTIDHSLFYIMGFAVLYSQINGHQSQGAKYRGSQK